MKKRDSHLDSFVTGLMHDVSDGTATFLVGAGVSALAPSNLPSGYGLKDTCLTAIARNRSDLFPFLASVRGSKRWTDLAPEILFQSFSEVLLTNLTQFFTFLTLSQPNLGHAVLAHLSAKSGQPILTTNFDNLVESSLVAEKKVVHLHGDLSRPEELIFRINQVGKGLETKLRTAVLRCVRAKTLYVFGYSGADRDIIHVLRESEVRRVEWIVHPDPALRGPVESLSDLFGEVCRFVPVDLRRLFAALAAEYSVGIRPKKYALREQRRKHIELWASTVSTAEAWACIGRSCQVTEDYGKAKRAYLKGGSFATEQLSGPWFLNEAANAMHIAGRFDRCELYANQAILSNIDPSDSALQAGSLNLLGLARLQQKTPDPKAALSYFRAAISIVEELVGHPLPAQLTEDGLQVLLSRLYNNVGLAYANSNAYKRARRYYLRSLNIKRSRGDLLGEARTAGNICCLDYGYRRFSTAYYWKSKTLGIVEMYGLVFDRANLARRLGELCCQQGRKKQGLQYLRTALSLYSDNPDLRFGVNLTNRSILKYK